MKIAFNTCYTDQNVKKLLTKLRVNRIVKAYMSNSPVCSQNGSGSIN